jgi:hypothetical protein
MITHQEFLEKYLRTPQDIDKAFGYQCVDLAKLYALEVHGITLGAF